MNLVAHIKKGILSGIAKSGGRGFITEQISDEGIRALAELLTEGLIIWDESIEDSMVLFITRNGVEEAERQ